MSADQSRRTPNHDTAERRRLESIQRNVDSHTVRVIETLPITASWDCLELGAGAGSIAYWLAARCPRGRVVAADLDTALLDPARAANLEIDRVDISAPDYRPGGFDLVHARYLFCHLPERDAVLARAARWLKPDGWLVVEEPYQLPAETSPFPLLRRLMAAYQQRCAAGGTDLTWARSVPAALAGSGLAEIGFTGNLGHLGGGPGDRWAPLIAQAGPALVADGLLGEDDLAGFFALLDDPAFVDIPQVTISAWGRRPATPPCTRHTDRALGWTSS